jgi:prevent-host-death family protein
VKEIAAGEFKAKCLAIMDRVQKSGEPVIVTKRGKPVVQVLAVREQADAILGYMRGKVEIVGDIVGPVVPLGNWECK